MNTLTAHEDKLVGSDITKGELVWLLRQAQTERDKLAGEVHKLESELQRIEIARACAADHRAELLRQAEAERDLIDEDPTDDAEVALATLAELLGFEGQPPTDDLLLLVRRRLRRAEEIGVALSHLRDRLDASDVVGARHLVEEALRG